VVPQVKTQVRFCQQGIDPRGKRVRCSGSAAAIRNNQANHFATAASELLDADFPWHRVSVSGLGPRTYPNDPDGAYHWNFGAPASDATQNTSHVWSFKTDESNWLRLGQIPPYSTLDADVYAACTATGLGGLGGTCLTGTFWTHAETDVGANTAGATFVDLQGTRRDVGVHDIDLSNHFFDLQPDQPYAYQRHGTGVLPDRPFFIWETLPDPYWSERTRRAAVVLPGPQTELGTAYSLQSDGTSVEITPALAAEVRSLFGSPEIMVASPVEPSSRTGRLQSNILGAFVRVDGTAVVPFSASGLRGRTLGTGRLATAASLGSTPPPRAAPIAVFSRVAAGTFVLGGTDPNGTPMHDLWFQPAGGEFSAVTLPDAALGEVRAATFAFVDRHLWVVDELTSAHAKHSLRLLRIEPTTGAVDVVATWQHAESHCRQSRQTTYSLVVATTGAPILTVSTGNRNTVLELAVGAHGLHVSATDHVEGTLDMPPIVDSQGLSYVLKQRDGSLRIERRGPPTTHSDRDHDHDRDDRDWIGTVVDPR
jgi:hypothetical protein